jgi:hypothetical protein
MLNDFADYNPVAVASQALMGMNGDRYTAEILETEMLSEQSYNEICENIAFNGKDSIVKHFGIFHWYYMKGKRA